MALGHPDFARADAAPWLESPVRRVEQIESTLHRPQAEAAATRRGLLASPAFWWGGFASAGFWAYAGYLLLGR